MESKCNNGDCPAQARREGYCVPHWYSANHVKNSEKQEPVINRFEVITDERQVVVRPDQNLVVTYDVQDEGRTLKVFIGGRNDRPPQ